MKYQDLREIIVNNIHDIRTSKGITQDLLAERMGYKNRTSIAKIENGRNFSLKILLRYADALEVDYLELLKK